MADALQRKLGYVDPREETGRASPFWGTLEVGTHDMLQMFSAFGYAMANRVGADPAVRDRLGRAYQAEQGYGEEAVSELPAFRQEQLAQPIGLSNFNLATFGAQFLRNAPSFAAGAAATAAGGLPGAAAMGGVLTGGDAMSPIVDYFSTASDEEIAANPEFADLVARGMTPAQIKQHALTTTIGNKDLGSTLLGAGLGLIAPETVLTRVFQGKGLKLGLGRMAGTGVGTAGGAATGAVEEAVPAIVQNMASEQTGGAIPETSVADAMIAGAILEAPGGAAAGFTVGGKKNSQVTTLQPGQVSPATASALQTTQVTQPAQQPTPPATSATPPTPPASTQTAPPAGATQPAGTPPKPPSQTPQNVQGTVPGSNTAPPPSPGPVPTGPTTPPPPTTGLAPDVEQALTGTPSIEPTPIEDEPEGAQAIPEQALPDSKIPLGAPVQPNETVIPIDQIVPPTPGEAGVLDLGEITERGVPAERIAVPSAVPGQPGGTAMPVAPDVDAVLASGGWKPQEIARLTPEQKQAHADAILSGRRERQARAPKTGQVEAAPIEDAPLSEVTPEVTTLEAVPEAPLAEPPANVVQGPENVVQAPEATPIAPEAQIEPTGLPEAPAAISTVEQQAVPEVLPEVEAPAQPTMQDAFAPSLQGGPVEAAPILDEPEAAEDNVVEFKPRVLEVAPTEENAAKIAQYERESTAEAPKPTTKQVTETKRQEQKATGKPEDLINARKDLKKSQKKKMAETDPGVAKNLFDKYVGVGVDDYTAPGVLGARLATIVDEADAHSIGWWDRVTKATPDYMVWLQNVRDTLDQIKQGLDLPETKQAITEFQKGELGVKAGDFTIFRGERGAKGTGRSGGGKAAQTKSGAKGQAVVDVEQLADTEVAVDEAEGVYDDRSDDTEGDTEVDTSTEITDNIPPPTPANDTQKAAVEGVDYTVPKGTSNVAVVTGRQRFAKQKPAGVPGQKITLKPRSKPETKPAEPTEAQIKQETDQVQENVEAVSRETPEPPTIFPSRRAEAVVTPEVTAENEALRHTEGAVEFSDGNWIKPVEQTTVRDAIAEVRGIRHKQDHITRILNHILDVALRAVPDIKVHIVAADDFNRSANMDPNEPVYSDAFYHNAKGKEYIVVSDSVWGTGRSKYVIAHELIHAITVDTLLANDGLRNTFNDYLQQLRDVLGQKDGRVIYGLTDVHEFFAELANPEFVQILKNTPVDRKVASKFGLEGWRKATAWNAIVALVRKVFGGTNDQFSLYDVMLSSFERMSHTYDRASAVQYRGRAKQAAAGDTDFVTAELAFSRIRDRTRERIDARNKAPTTHAIQQYFAPTSASTARTLNSRINSTAAISIGQALLRTSGNLMGSVARWTLGMRSGDDLMRNYDALFGNQGLLRRALNALVRRYVEAQKGKDADAKLIMEEAKLLDQYKNTKVGTGANAVSAAEAYSDLLEEMDNWRIDPRKALKDHTWLGKNAVKGILPKKHYPDVVKAYQALQQAAPGLATFVGKKTDYYGAKIKEAIDATLAEAVIDADLIHNNNTSTLTYAQALAMGHRIMANKATTHDESVIGKKAIERIHKTPEFKVEEGPYNPAMRFGDWIVSAKVDVADPTFGTWQKPSAPNTANPEGYTVDFSGPNAERDATRFAYQLANGDTREEYSELKQVYTDKNGNEYVPDPKAPGGLHKLGPKDVQQGAEARWRVWINDDHVAFRESQSEAQQITEDLKKDKYYKTVNEVRLKRGEPTPGAAMQASHQLQAIQESFAKRYGPSSNQGVAGVVNLILREAAARAAPGSSISKRRMQKRHVAGRSNDTLRVMHAYSTQMNNYIAAVKTQREIHDAFKALEDSVRNNYTKDQPMAQAVLDEFKKRRDNMQGLHERGGDFAPLINTLTSFQVLDKLFSPGYSITNLTQWPMVGFPVLAEKFGAFQASRAMGKAFKDIGFAAVLGKGLKDSGNAITKRLDKATNFHDFILSGPNITPQVKTMFDTLRDLGTLDPDAGFEALQVVAKSTTTKALHKVESVFRAFPRAVEAAMRYSVAKAAYDMGIAKGWSVEKATQEARDAVEKSMLNYNPANSARFFSHPMGQIGFQFMKFAFGMYQLMGGQIATILRQRSTKQERLEAARGFGLLIGAHFFVAGATGLPTEPIRVPLFLLNTMGLIDFTMDDLETGFRALMTDVTGSETIGEVLARGFPRLMGLDMSNRVSLGQLVFQRPLGEIEDSQDFLAYAAKYLIGPTGSWGADMVAAWQYAMDGDIVRAIEKGFPVKFVSDVANAYRGATTGLKTKYGDVYHTYSPLEAIGEAIGLGTAGAANTAEARNYYYSQQEQQQEERRDILQDYRDNPGNRGQFYRRFQEFNKKWQPHSPLNIKAAQDYLKEHTGNYKKGIKEEPSNKGLLQRIERFIN